MKARHKIWLGRRFSMLTVLLAGAISLAISRPGVAADEQDWQELFNGKNLAGWRDGAGHWMTPKRYPSTRQILACSKSKMASAFW